MRSSRSENYKSFSNRKYYAGQALLRWFEEINWSSYKRIGLASSGRRKEITKYRSGNSLLFLFIMEVIRVQREQAGPKTTRR
jgi:hypothetical protein